MANSNLVQLIKKIAMDAFGASKPCDYFIGVVAKGEPLTIKLSGRITIDEDFLQVAQKISETQLKKGDRVLMLRKSGGKEYMIIDRVVN